jgi:hypothetical protein
MQLRAVFRDGEGLARAPIGSAQKESALFSLDPLNRGSAKMTQYSAESTRVIKRAKPAYRCRSPVHRHELPGSSPRITTGSRWALPDDRL